MISPCFCFFNLKTISSSSYEERFRVKLSLQNLSFTNKYRNLKVNNTLIANLEQRDKTYSLNLYFYNFITTRGATPINTSSNTIQFFKINDSWRFLNFLPPVLYIDKKNLAYSIYLYSRTPVEKLSQRRLVNSFLNYSFAAYRRIFNSLSMAWFVNLYFIGVGYKIFVYNDYLYIRLGFSRMLKIKIPESLYVLTRYRNNIKLISSDRSLLNTFVHQLLLLRVFNPYKGKGIYQLSDFSDIKLKVGKKQQFF